MSAKNGAIKLVAGNSNRALAEAIIQNDTHLNQTRYDLEDQCYTLLATQSPMAGDLREIISILLIAIELERIADHAQAAGLLMAHVRPGAVLHCSSPGVYDPAGAAGPAEPPLDPCSGAHDWVAAVERARKGARGRRWDDAISSSSV